MNNMIPHKALSVLAAVLMTSACVAERSPSDSPKQATARVVAESYVVKLGKRGKSMPAGEKQGLDDYLSHLGDLQAIEFSVRRTHRDMALKSLAPVEKELIARGANPAKIVRLAEIGVDYQGKLADVEVIAKRYVAIAPSCPDQSVPADPLGNQNLNSSNFGCATATALALQVADPRDLTRGRETGSANGAHSAAAVDRYQTDQVKSIDDTTTQSVTTNGVK
jgi:pilus biogenesis lipoprotein CpaD